MAGFVKVMGYTAKDVDDAYQRGKAEGTVSYTEEIRTINLNDMDLTGKLRTTDGQGHDYFMPVSTGSEGNYLVGVHGCGYFPTTYDKLAFIGDLTKSSNVQGYGIVAVKMSTSETCHLVTWGKYVNGGNADTGVPAMTTLTNAQVRADLNAWPAGNCHVTNNVVSDMTALGIKKKSGGTSGYIYIIPAGVKLCIIGYGKNNREQHYVNVNVWTFN